MTLSHQATSVAASAGSCAVWFVSGRTLQQIYDHGFTHFYSGFAWSESPQEAECLAKQYLASYDVQAESLKAVPANTQDLSAYVFLDQILGLPASVMEREYTRRGVPRPMIDEELRKASQRAVRCMTSASA